MRKRHRDVNKQTCCFGSWKYRSYYATIVLVFTFFVTCALIKQQKFGENISICLWYTIKTRKIHTLNDLLVVIKIQNALLPRKKTSSSGFYNDKNIPSSFSLCKN